MMNLEQVQKALKNSNLTEVSRHVNITVSYLSYLANGKRLNPSYDTLKRLSDYLEKQHG